MLEVATLLDADTNVQVFENDPIVSHRMHAEQVEPRAAPKAQGTPRETKEKANVEAGSLDVGGSLTEESLCVVCLDLEKPRCDKEFVFTQEEA